MNQIFLIGTGIAAAAALTGALVFHKTEIFFQFVLKLAMGAAGIYFINTVLKMCSIESGVGLNGMTLFTAGTLGLPGLLLMYGVSFYLQQ